MMPDYEARILRLLTRDSLAYWVADATSSEINSLVEYPLTTVVLVLKLPGSHVELEIKRAGGRGVNPLGVVSSRRRQHRARLTPARRRERQEGLRTRSIRDRFLSHLSSGARRRARRAPIT